MTDGDQQQGQEQLIGKSGRQPFKSAEFGARPRIGKHGGVLLVAFQKHRLSGDRIHARVDHRERRGNAEHVMPVMHHAMRMAIGLGQKGFFGSRLVFGAPVMLLAHPERGDNACRGQQQSEDQQRAQREPGPQPQLPFRLRNGEQPAHRAAAWVAKAA